MRAQAGLVADAHTLVARIAAPTPFLVAALDDLDALQEPREERARALAELR